MFMKKNKKMDSVVAFAIYGNVCGDCTLESCDLFQCSCYKEQDFHNNSQSNQNMTVYSSTETITG